MENWIDLALELHEEGLQVLALTKGAKIPAHQWQFWQTVRQTEDDLLDIADYFQSPEPPEWLRDEGGVHTGRPWLSTSYKARRHWPKPVPLDIGVVTGGLSGVVVIDCDTAEARDYAASIGLTDTPMVVQTTKGWHYWFRHTGEVRNAASKGVAGLDIRGDGGLVRVPPSTGLKWLSRSSIDELPPFPGMTTPTPSDDGPTFSDLDLTEYAVKGQTAEEWIMAKCQGQQVTKGERNETMKLVVGQLIHERRDKEWVLDEAKRLGAIYWDHEKYAGKQTEIIVDSLWRADVQNHPDLHGGQQEEEEPPKPLVGYLSDATSERFIDSLPPRKPAFVETILEPGKATMVAGYSGSGKSELLMMLLKAACDPTKLGSFVGPWQIQSTPRALVLDPENNPHLIADRLKRFGLIGNSGDNLRVVPGSVPGPDGMMNTALNLTTKAGIGQLSGLLEVHSPDIVVFDTVRSHFPGLKENEAAEWTAYNLLTQKLTRAGLCVVWLHHSNKPGADGYSTEAGSSHAMTNISTQIFVRPVYQDEEMAQRKYGIWDHDEKFQTNVRGVACTPYQAIGLTHNIAEPLDRVSQIAYGKVREANPITERSYYLGQRIEAGDWRPTLHSTISAKQAAMAMATNPRFSGLADPLLAISKALRVPVPLLVEWGLNVGGQGTQP